MRLRGYQLGELIGIVLLLASTAMQLFYLEPLKREIEWRLVGSRLARCPASPTNPHASPMRPQFRIELRKSEVGTTPDALEIERLSDFLLRTLVGRHVFDHPPRAQVKW